MSNTSDTPIEISHDKPSELFSVDAESVLPVEKPDISPESVSPLLSAKPIESGDPPQLSTEKSVSAKPDLETESERNVHESVNTEKLSLVVYFENVDRSVLSVDPVSHISDKSSIEDCPVEVPQKLSVEPVAELSVCPRPSESIDGIPIYTSSNLAESLDHIRHFAGLPSASIDNDDERILAEVYGSQAPSFDPIGSLTVEETAHPDSTTFKIREVIKLLASSTVHVSETSNSVSPNPTKSSPVREMRKGDEHIESTQPEKKRKSADSEKAESDPPIKQVFKTLRSSVKNKAPTVVPSTTTRKMKATSKARGRSVTPDMQIASDSPDASVYTPQFVSATAQDKWNTMVRRELIVQRSVDENQLNSVCNILPLLSEVGLLKIVTSICSYSKLLTYEFYYNLNEEIDNLTSERCQQIFITGKWYVFRPDMINEYSGMKPVEEEEISDWDLVAKTLTGGLAPVWPTGDNDTLSSSEFTSKFVILHRIALHNWLPSAHFHTVGKQLAALLFRIGTKMTVDLGRWIFYHILTLIHPREQKVRLPYPNLIFGILSSQGLVPMQSEIITPSLLYTVDP
ncbi:PREDICTED: uncharacterized protein LOC109174176 [Ipomoea nil]|uniref:uncharacterized protein LOC109174176 n=1 Tax=Ipomoea nil TaxID=35883 RepID=UPI0009018EA1|nr:PREDICTED: uncharacterized protein LOC109174176 [Ipomoea nil]